MRIDKNTTIKLGDRNIVKIKIGDSVIWEKKTIVDETDYFYIESLGDGNTVSVKNYSYGGGTKATPTLEYSTDKKTWNTITFDWTYGTQHTTELPVKLNTGEKMYFRNDTRKFSNSTFEYISFLSSVSSNVGGDIRTLSNYLDVDSETKPQPYMFCSLFRGNKFIVDASNLRLPYTTLEKGCYSGLFENCSSLTTPPTEFPATTLANNCCENMFIFCSSLTTAPTLHATKLETNCYYQMFSNCSKLKSITVHARDISATNCTNGWLSNVASSGTFNNMGFAPFKTGSSGIPSGWTEVVPPIESITANPDTFTIKSYNLRVTCKSTLTITTTTGITTTRNNSATITVGENTGDITRTLTETIPYKGSSYQVTIIQTANDVRPPMSWNVVSEGTYPFQLNTNGYYESTNKGQNSSYSYATLNYEGFDELILECINSGETYNDYGIISQPDVQLSESTSDDGATGSTNVFKNFKGQSSTNPVQIVIPSDVESHFITIKFRKDSTVNDGNDSLQFKVIEPTT